MVQISTEWREIAKKLAFEEQKAVHIVDVSIENGQFPNQQEMQAVLDAVRKLLPLGFITHNAVILFVLEIYDRFPDVRKFYQCFYPLIVVDEFQDTNCIAWKLLQSIIDSNRSQLLFLGDSLQRIFGFIGALPDIMGIVVGTHNMTRVAFETNHRFQSNPEMLKLDKTLEQTPSHLFRRRLPKMTLHNCPPFGAAPSRKKRRRLLRRYRA